MPDRSRLRRACGAIASLAVTGCADALPTPAFEPETQVAIEALTAGHEHTCALDREGTAFCWGANDKGQLGTGDLADAGVPRRVATDERFASIVGGFAHTCALTASGTAWCWGENAFGQLGDGTTESRLSPSEVVMASPLAGISAGGVHTCGWTIEGESFCWGDNREGQLGDGTRTGRSTPLPVSGGLLYLDLDAGLFTTCGRARSEEVHCWGSDEHGLIPGGVTNSYLVPTATGVSGIDLALAQRHACVLTVTGAGGRTACWGDNSEAQLGDGTTDPRYSPVSPNGAPDFVQLTEGSRNMHTCGVTRDRQIRCWGANNWAQSGQSTARFVVPPTSIDGGRSVYAQVAAGSEHSCAVDLGGAVHCWGTNRRGQLGRGSDVGSITRATPRPVVWEDPGT